MDELKELVKALENAKGDEQEQKLHEICKKLINSYTIQIGDIKIEPMLVEAYYYCDEKFKDKSVHAAYSDSKAPTYELARERQKNKFGELYVHYGCKDGIDIVLSDGNYYLSFLVKNALVNGDFKTQSAISEYICGKCDEHDECDKGVACKYYGKKGLLKKLLSGKSERIIFLARKNIKGNFADKKLAACLLQAVFDNNNFTLADGYKKQWRCSVRALSEISDEEKAREKASEYNGSKIEDRYWKLAKESLEIE